ncbi:MAG TPA: hypothetical protein VFX42_11425 [Gemmatimonadales bacterium]|nr:hypothetical protein [Gemmatimonadales bacterium]
MYRIELSPGEETVFRSIEELAVAIKRGVVTPRARIFHNASSKWLPIQFHPHYKTALSMPLSQSALVAGPPVKPLAPLKLEQPIGTDPLPLPAPAPKPVEASAAPAPRKKAAKEKSASGKRPRRQGKSGRQLRIALVGALFLGGAQWVLSAQLFSRGDIAGLFRSHRRLVVAPANTAAMVPVIPTEEPPSAPALRRPAAPASAPSFGGSADSRVVRPAPVAKPAVDSSMTDEIEPAPVTIDVSTPRAPSADSLASKSSDSANRKAIKGILRAVTKP